MKKFNFKNPRSLIILVSTFVSIVLISGLTFGIYTKYNKKNTKETIEYISKESETKKDDPEKSSVSNIESSTEQTAAEESITESDSKENTTEESSTEDIASDNEIIDSNNESDYNDNSYSENNDSENSNSNNEDQNNNDDSNNSNNENNNSNPEPSYTPPSNEPSNDTPKEDHIVYKSDSSINLNESYWVNVDDAIMSILNSNEMKNFKEYIEQKYNYNGDYSTNMNFGGKHDTWNVYDFYYFIKKSDKFINFYFNGSEFIEK